MVLGKLFISSFTTNSARFNEFNAETVIVFQIDLFSTVIHLIIAYHISLLKVQGNYFNNNLLILNVKQLNKFVKLYCFHTLKALWNGQGKIKIYYGMSRVKKQPSGKRFIKDFRRSIKETALARHFIKVTVRPISTLLRVIRGINRFH